MSTKKLTRLLRFNIYLFFFVEQIRTCNEIQCKYKGIYVNAPQIYGLMYNNK